MSSTNPAKILSSAHRPPSIPAKISVLGRSSIGHSRRSTTSARQRPTSVGTQNRDPDEGAPRSKLLTERCGNILCSLDERPRLAATSAGLLQMTMLDASTSWTVAFPGLVLCGLGFGLANPTVASVTLAVAPPRLAATATGMNSTFRQVGVAAGVAALGAIFDHALDQGHGDLTGAALRAAIAEDYSAGLDRVFVVSALVAAAGAVLSTCLVRVRAAP